MAKRMNLESSITTIITDMASRGLLRTLYSQRIGHMPRKLQKKFGKF